MPLQRPALPYLIPFLLYGLTAVACVHNSLGSEQPPEIPVTRILPYSDPGNRGGWVLNEAVSDEFTEPVLDESKWLVQGRNGEYRSNFIGRPPAQFSPDNVRIEDGMLRLEARWEPDYPFSPTVDRRGEKFENYTTAAVISKQAFRYGYLEIRCRAAEASMADIEKERTAEAGPSAWTLSKPVHVWVDSETFPWHGLPAPEDLPADFVIDYIRIWQKP